MIPCGHPETIPAPPRLIRRLRAVDVVRSQIATLQPSRGQHRKYRPYVFTEQDVAKLSSVLHSEPAIQENIAVLAEPPRSRVQREGFNGWKGALGL